MNIDINKPLAAIPTNIITGFLGVGKTSAILHLLKHKSVDERWAVLVNEFGEIGVDGSLFEGNSTQEQGVFIREVPGGCMCCTAGLPMKIALAQLLLKAKPDRLLVEPTGLGHPTEVLQVLSGEYYRELLSLQKVLTLVDARKLNDPRYTQHETFNQQIELADIVIGNKLDLYGEDNKSDLISYVKEKGQAHAEVYFSQYGELPPEFLQGNTVSIPHNAHHHHHEPEVRTLVSDLPIPESGYLKANNEGEGYHSVGWRFSPQKIFNHDKLFSLLNGVCADRMKAVFITNKGVFSYNLTSDALTELPLGDTPESRIEIIATGLNDHLEAQLLTCLM